MLLHTLRRSHTLARLVLVWFVLAMGVAVAAPTLQPLALGDICSAAPDSADPQKSSGNTDGHHTLQCVLCLNAGAPPQTGPAPFSAVQAATPVVPHAPVAVALAPRPSPLAARAPPAR